MRVIYHHRTQAGDAQGIHINEMIKAFEELGHIVVISALVSSSNNNKKKTSAGFWSRLTHLVPSWVYELMSLAYNFYGYRDLKRKIIAKRPDFIYERYSLNTFCGVWASRKFKIPFILEVNAPLRYEQDQLGQLTFKRIASFSERWICSNSNWTLVVSNVMKKLLVHEGIPANKIIVMPNGIDPNKFNPEVSGDTVRKQYDLKGKQVIGFVGWFRKWHGLEMFLEVMNQMQLAKNGVRLLLVGDGPAYEDLHHYVIEHNLESDVIFTGPVKREEIPAHIAAMDIAVQPSATEYACPIKIMEYLAMGKCIVAADQPNIREIIQNGFNGYLFRAGDSKHFGTVIHHAINNLPERKVICNNAYQSIYKENYLWSSNAKKVENLLRAGTADN